MSHPGSRSQEPGRRVGSLSPVCCAEYEALRNFPFDEFRFGAITIEHNNREDRRAKIRELLLKNGYRLEWAIRDQDWYVEAKRSQ